MRSNYKKLGGYIRQVDERNKDGSEENLLGVSTQKYFIESIANTNGTDFRGYKKVQCGQFVYVSDTSRRGDKIGIALLTDRDEGIVSSAYTVFEIIDTTKLWPEYLMLWFKRPEFDRYARFHSHGSVREIFGWDELCNVELPIPSLQRQKEIVDAYETIESRIKLKRQINDNLQQQVSVLYQSWFESFDITNGVCPENWGYQELSTIAHISSGKRPPIKSGVCNKKKPIPIVGAASVMGFTSEANHTDKIIVTGRVGTHGIIQRFNTPCWVSDNTLVITSHYYEFTNQILHRIDYSSMNRGSTQPLITQGDLKKVVVLVPDEEALIRFEKYAGSLMVRWEANNNENVKLALLRDTLLPKLMSGEIDVSKVEI